MKHNACIISFFMSNINMKTVEKQHAVVDKFNKSRYPHYAIHTELRHGASMDLAWAMNGIDHPSFKGHQIEKKFDHDILFFLDIDALPLNEDAIDYYIDKAAEGKLIGNIQNSNHIKNNKHLFAAPSALAMSVDTFVTIGRPSALETSRADVAEEYTYAAEASKIIPIELLLPLKFDEAPAECPHWTLREGMPVYGRGTTFGYGEGHQETIWHQFQSFHPGQQEKFWKKCDELLGIKSEETIVINTLENESNG